MEHFCGVTNITKYLSLHTFVGTSTGVLQNGVGWLDASPFSQTKQPSLPKSRENIWKSVMVIPIPKQKRLSPKEHFTHSK